MARRPDPAPQFTAQGRHQQLADFEEHLDDLGRDWLDARLLQGPA